MEFFPMFVQYFIVILATNYKTSIFRWLIYDITFWNKSEKILKRKWEPTSMVR